MSTTNKPLPGDPEGFANPWAAEGGHRPASDHEPDPVSRGHARRRLRDALLEGARSQIAGNADAAYFASLRESAESGV